MVIPQGFQIESVPISKWRVGSFYQSARIGGAEGSHDLLPAITGAPLSHSVSFLLTKEAGDGSAVRFGTGSCRG